MDGSWWTVLYIPLNLSHRHVPFVLQQCVSRRMNIRGLLFVAAMCPQPHVSVAQWEGSALVVRGGICSCFPSLFGWCPTEFS